MTLMDAISIFSLFVGIASIILAIYAMASANRSEERSKKNFENTQAMMREFYDRTKDLLNDIDKRANAIETVTSSSQEKLLSTVTAIVNETVLPKKEDAGEKFAMLFMQQLLSNPQGAKDMMNALKPFIEMSQPKEAKKKDG
ncbi:MAG: hypothetical protein HYZ49_10125 [Chloroflexi bacterium]|nr:hypothetical protein [Chloroflexota bacterium]